jgi:ketosteroid isomerase-like protein
MKKLIIACLLFIPFLINAQTTEEKEVAGAVEQLKTAMVNADKNSLENLAAKKLSYGHSSGAVDDKKTFVEKIVSGQSDFVSIDLTEQTISISGKVAVVRHVLKAKTNDAGKGTGEINLKILLIWQKQKDGWKLLARQAVKI